MLKVGHNSGFFSCTTIRLESILDYIKSNSNLPKIVDSSTQFAWYKPSNKRLNDITFDYFENYENIDIDINTSKTNEYFEKDDEIQFINYAKLNYSNICPIIQKYFYPSLNIINTMKNIEKKYSLNYENICVLFYRGNDKITETKLSTYEEYLRFSNEILAKKPDTLFLIQSDETEFIQFMVNIYPNNSIYFKDEIRHIKKTCTSVDLIMCSDNYKYSQYYLAITIIMSKCKFVICGSGNCSLWIMLYRGNNRNTVQYLNGAWINTLVIH